MIKRFLFLALLMLVPFVSAAQTVPPLSTGTTITSSWTPPVNWIGSGSAMLCSSTISTYCLSSYTETITPPAGGGAANILTIASNAVTNAWTPGGFLYCGTWTVSLVANWLDANGQPAVSVPISKPAVASCPFTASPATNLVNKVS